ncbi:DUF3068 domain-containing protein [Actinomadura atramentaria]|uniref:DUF3068 domain-containing protein n=1 Tax=Actinomadura atramentaria TaxID=1990 RepID=UPI00039F0DE1|nr:DUF3068 domain-containing protein [Actinomadura atramentaria]
MRRTLGMILVTLGAFCMTLAPLVRFYVADKVVVAPLNQYQKTVLEAPNAQYFDQAAFKTRTNVTLVATNIVRGDVRANNGDDRIAVWDSSTDIRDKERDQQIDLQAFRVAFNRKTGELVNCCAVQVAGDTNVKMSGYGILFPIANVHKRDYPFFDMTTRQIVPVRYDGTEKILGIKTYRFTQQVPLTKTEALDAKIPADMLGMQKTDPAQKVDRYFTAAITQWVDPRTGIPIKTRQNIRNTLATPDGRGSMTVAQADLLTTPASQKALADKSNSTAFKIGAAQGWGPLSLLFGGLSLLLIGTAVGLAGGARGPQEPPAPRRADGKFGDLRTASGAPEDEDLAELPRVSDGRFRDVKEDPPPVRSADGRFNTWNPPS